LTDGFVWELAEAIFIKFFYAKAAFIAVRPAVLWPTANLSSALCKLLEFSQFFWRNHIFLQKNETKLQFFGI